MKLRVLVGVVASSLVWAGCSLQWLAPPDQDAPRQTPIPSRTPVPAQAKRLSPDRPVRKLADVTLPGMAAAVPGVGLAGYVAQEVTWSQCDQFECAKVLVPYSYADPQRKAITLSLLRRRGQGGEPRPAVFVNPGGPGAGGTKLARSKRWSGLPNVDIVGWDPRGTGDSTPVTCVADPKAAQPGHDELLAADVSPDTMVEYEELVARERKFADDCATYSGDYLNHVGTDETVQDMELLRQLLKQPQFNFIGYSYGTYLGATYVHQYPQSAGKVVLDSPVNVTGDDSIPQARGFDRALTLFAEWDIKGHTELGNTKEQVVAKITGWLDELDRKPLAVGKRKLTQTLALTGVVAYLYGGVEQWRDLHELLVRATGGSGKELLASADQFLDRNDDGSYDTPAYAFSAIGCRDQPDAGLSDALRQWDADARRARIFGFLFGPGTVCEQWPASALPERTDFSTTSSTPVLVVGSTGDAATPYEYAPWMRDALKNAVLLTFDGPGHGTTFDASDCIDGHVKDYFAGKTPPDNTTCTK